MGNADLQWKTLTVRKLGHETSLAAFTGQYLINGIVLGSAFLKLRNRVSGNYWKV